MEAYQNLRYNFQTRFFSLFHLYPPPPHTHTHKSSKFQKQMKSKVCINLLVMRRDWKENKAQLYGPLDGTYFVMLFISKLSLKQEIFVPCFHAGKTVSQ